MNTIRKTIIISFSILFLSTGCVRKLRKSKIALSEINIQQCDFDYFKAKSKVHYQDDNQSLSAVLNIRIRKDSAIWLSASVMAEVMRTVITTDSVFFYQKLPSKVYKEYSISELSKQTGVALDYRMLESIFLGNLLVYNESNSKITQNELTYTITEDNDKFTLLNFFDKSMGKVTEVMLTSADQKSSAIIEYLKHAEVDSCSLPKKIIFSSTIKGDSTTSNNRLELNYSKTKFSTEPIRFPFHRKK